MSKWHRVELTADQMGDLWVAGFKYDPEFDEGRVKVRPYERFINDNGETIKTPVRFETMVARNEIIYLYKFKNEIDAMAFKLKWG